MNRASKTIVAGLVICFACSTASAQVTVTITELIPDADRDELLNSVVDYSAKVKFTVAAGDTNTYDVRIDYYFLDPQTNETISGPITGNASAGSPANLAVSGAKQVDQVGIWAFGVRTYYRVTGTSTWTTSIEQHYHINVYPGGGGG